MSFKAGKKRNMVRGRRIGKEELRVFQTVQEGKIYSLETTHLSKLYVYRESFFSQSIEEAIATL